jgi:hypothetical protein
MTSVNADEWRQRCVRAAEARNSGEPLDPLSLSCPYLNEHIVAAADARAQGR